MERDWKANWRATILSSTNSCQRSRTEPVITQKFYNPKSQLSICNAFNLGFASLSFVPLVSGPLAENRYNVRGF